MQKRGKMKNKFRIVLFIISLFSMTGCLSPSDRLMEYPVTEIPREKIATIEASIVKLTPKPVPKIEDFSQEVEDIEDQAIESMIPLLAVKRLEEVLTKNMPDFQRASIYMTLGMKYEDLYNTEKAIENYSKSIELYNGNSYPLLYRGELYFREGKYDLAKSDIHKAIGQGGLDDYSKNEGLSYLLQIDSKGK